MKPPLLTQYCFCCSLEMPLKWFNKVFCYYSNCLSAITWIYIRWRWGIDQPWWWWLVGVPHHGDNSWYTGCHKTGTTSCHWPFYHCINYQCCSPAIHSIHQVCCRFPWCQPFHYNSYIITNLMIIHHWLNYCTLQQLNVFSCVFLVC